MKRDRDLLNNININHAFDFGQKCLCDPVIKRGFQLYTAVSNIIIDLFRQRSPFVGIVRNQGIGSVLWTSYLLMLGNAEVLRKDRILPFAFVSIDV